MRDDCLWRPWRMRDDGEWRAVGRMVEGAVGEDERLW
jgi:hypothetical protein